MALDNLTSIDMVVKETAHAKLTLLIVDGALHPSQKTRLEKLAKKIQLYVGYIVSPQFAKDYPNVKPEEVLIGVMCRQTPDETMAQMKQVRPKGKPDVSIRIACVQHDPGSTLPWFLEQDPSAKANP
jgi:hypothetical protein